MASANTNANIANYPDGQYQVTYQGTATLSFSGIGELTTPATLGSDGLYHAVLTVNHSWFWDGKTLDLQATGLNSAKPFGNLRIIMPGYSANTTQIFTNSLLQDLQPFSYIRMMEWNDTNYSTQVSWSARVTQNDFTAMGPKGASYEDIIAMANEANKNLWINVPAMANNTYILDLAELVHQDLNPNLSVYVEYSNETWNASFTQYYQVLSAAAANPLTTIKTGEWAVAQQTAFQTRYIGNVFKSVFGTESGRVLPVLGGEAAWTQYNEIELYFLALNYGPASNSIYAFAIAPYVNLPTGADVPGLTLPNLFAGLENSLDTTVANELVSNEAVAKYYRVPLISYEGGAGYYLSSVNPSLSSQVPSNPALYTLYKNMIALWNKDVGNQFTFYALNDSFWGLLPSVTSTGSQRWNAVMSDLLPAGDTNLDGKVTTADINTIEAHIGATGANWNGGDFNNDGVVNATDLAMAEANLPAIAAAATYVAQDTTTQGNWKGVYGSDGYNIIGDVSSLPYYASLGSNASTEVWSSSTTDVRALQSAQPGAAHRIAAAWYSSSSGGFTVNIDLPDGLTHMVTIYAADLMNYGRSDQVQVINAATGAVLDTRSLTSLAGGEYMSWDLTGNVTLRFTALTGPNPVLAGIFFDHVGSRLFVSTDTATKGNWKGVYGSDGYDIIGDVSSLPSYAQVTTTNASTHVWSNGTSDVRALEQAKTGATSRVAAALYNNNVNQFSVNIDLTDGLTHLVSIYATDWDSKARTERVDLIDQSTGTVLDSRVLSSFSGGEYLTWKMSGNVELRFTKVGGADPVLNAIFFDKTLSSSATFISSDTTTQGNWQGVYGNAGYEIIGGVSSLPSYAQVTTTNASTDVLSTSSTSVSALRSPSRAPQAAPLPTGIAIAGALPSISTLLTV